MYRLEPIVYYPILYYTILYYHYTILILYRTVLYYTILYYTILYYTILYYTILYYTILYYTITNLRITYVHHVLTAVRLYYRLAFKRLQNSMFLCVVAFGFVSLQSRLFIVYRAPPPTVDEHVDRY